MNITVKNTKKDSALIDPIRMLDNIWPHGIVFQQYVSGNPTKNYYITCGHYEDAVINIWYCDEECKYKLSTDNVKSLTEFLSHVKVKQIEAEVNLELLCK